MCMASKRLQELNCFLRNIEDDLKKLNRKQSEYDKKLSEHYHKIETAKFNAAEGYYLAKELQEILQKRRIIKNELRKMQLLHNQIRDNKIKEKVKRTKKKLKRMRKSSNKYQKNFMINKDVFERELLH